MSTIIIQTNRVGPEKDNCKCSRTSQSEAYLVVGDNVDCAVCGVVGQVTEMEGFVDHALASKGRITVKQHTHHLQSEIRNTALTDSLFLPRHCITFLETTFFHQNRTTAMVLLSKNMCGKIQTVFTGLLFSYFEYQVQIWSISCICE